MNQRLQLYYSSSLHESSRTLKNHIFANFDEAANLCKASNDPYNRGGWVVEGVAYNPHDLNA